MAFVAVAVLYTTTEAKVVKNYVVALWIVDITHIGVTAYGLGIERTLDVANWNSMTWGNVGITVSDVPSGVMKVADLICIGIPLFDEKSVSAGCLWA